MRQSPYYFGHLLIIIKIVHKEETLENHPARGHMTLKLNSYIDMQRKTIKRQNANGLKR